MKRFLAYILATCFLFCALSCEKTPEPSKEKPLVSATLEDICLKATVVETSATTATLEYAFNLDALSSMPIDVKIRYSLSESFPAEGTEVVRLNKERMSVTLTGLQFDRQYYYEVFVTLYDTEYNAERGNFRTLPASVMLNDPSESLEGLTVSGKVNGVSAEDLAEFNVLLYLTDVAMGNVQEHRLELAEDFTFCKIIDGLDIGAAYTYWVKLSQGTQKSVSSEEMTYSTQDPYLAAEKAIDGAAIDLSESSTANCYIVPSSGVYKFKLVKGNTNESVGDVKSVRILWESFGTAVKPVALELICATCKDGDYAVFKVPQPYNKGNAVIAAYDAQDNILWSWHIWLTADSISGETYYVSSNGAFTDEVAGVVMDRNLGALSKDVNSVEAYGLFYQWGRKDPYLGSANAAGTAFAVSTRSLRVAIVDASMQTIDYTVANPHVFLVGNSRKDWIGEKNNTLWTNSTKTKYDPCPPGWRIPDGGTGLNGVQAGLWAKIGMSAYGKTQMPSSWQSGWKGMMFPVSKTGYSSWYPVAGGIGLDAALKLVGVDGTYWTAAAIGGEHDYVFAMNFYFVKHATTTDYYEYCSTEVPRATGNSVRCCKE